MSALRHDVAEKVKAILVEDFRVPAAKIRGDATFRGTLALDSLDAVDLVFLATKALDLPNDVKAFRDLHTFDEVVDKLCELRAAKDAAGT